MNWICTQIGAREHYAIPRVLHREGKLDSLYADFWATAGWRMLGKLTGKILIGNRFLWEGDGKQVVLVKAPD